MPRLTEKRWRRTQLSSYAARCFIATMRDLLNSAVIAVSADADRIPDEDGWRPSPPCGLDVLDERVVALLLVSLGISRNRFIQFSRVTMPCRLFLRSALRDATATSANPHLHTQVRSPILRTSSHVVARAATRISSVDRNFSGLRAALANDSRSADPGPVREVHQRCRLELNKSQLEDLPQFWMTGVGPTF